MIYHNLNKMAANVNNMDVVFEVNGAEVPNCPHGPTLLFVRYGSDGKSNKRFYACSACRDRKECSFYQLEDEKVSEAKWERRKEFNESQQPPFTHQEYQQRLKEFRENLVGSRNLCLDCDLLLLPAELKQHQEKSHVLKNGISDEQLSHPSLLFSPHKKDKVFAQYHFDKSTLNLIKNTLELLKVTHVLCLGTPSIHETIQNEKGGKLQSLLLDLDHRYMQIYSSDKFCRYNMFNNHFFNNTNAEETFQEFLTEKVPGKKLAIIVDPPFGCMVEILAHSYNTLLKQWQDLSEKKDDTKLTTFLFLPYFLEKRVLDSFPTFSMLDYKVTYMNHPEFIGGKSKTGSTVRMFTSVEPRLVCLPAKEGYWYCKDCCRYSSSENKHCDKCASCTSKDGHTYIHCDKCSRCVKPNRVHCDECNSCQKAEHQCGIHSGAGCHICGDLTHKRKYCPQNRKAFNKRKQLKPVRFGAGGKKNRN